MNIRLPIISLCMLCMLAPFAAPLHAQGLAAQSLTLADARINQVLKGDSAILNNLAGKIVVLYWAPEHVDITPKPADPPSNWKGSKAAWSRYRADYPKARKVEIERKSDHVKAFESLRRKYKDQANVVFLGIGLTLMNKDNVDQAVEQFKITFPIAKPADDGQLPSRAESQVIIYDASGKAIHTGPVDSMAESVLKKAVRP